MAAKHKQATGFWGEGASAIWRVARGAWLRFTGRDVMLFAGGVSFFGLLAIFPALVIAISVYGLLASPQDAAALALRLTEILPRDARAAVSDQIVLLAGAPPSILSLNGLLALGVALFGATRGVKAVLAGLNRICTSKDVRSILRFNLLAVALTLAAILAAFAASLLLLSLPVAIRLLPDELETGLGRLLGNAWLWSAAVMFGAVALLYRFAMAQGKVRWRASLIGAGAATALWLGIAQAFTFYVSQLANFGATYGGIGAVVVFLMWLYVAAYALFFGAAVATETEIEIEAQAARARAAADRASRRARWRARVKALWTRLPFIR